MKSHACSKSYDKFEEEVLNFIFSPLYVLIKFDF